MNEVEREQIAEYLDPKDVPCFGEWLAAKQNEEEGE